MSTERKRATMASVVLGVVGVAFIWQSFAAVNPNLQGDLNGDNKVTIADLSILLSNFNKTGDTADLNGDGKVTIADLSILLSNWGKTYSGGGTTPPPTTPPPTTPPPTTPPTTPPTPVPPTAGQPTVKIDGKDYPNPLTLKNGQPVSTKAIWESQRRAELLQDFRQNVYGFIPEPTNVTFDVKPTTSGSNVRKNVTINYTGPNGSGSFPIRVFIPKSEAKPKGTFVIIDHRNNGSDDFNQNSDYMPIAKLLQNGYAVAPINVGNDVAADGGGYRDKVISKMIGADKDNAARAIGAWSWAAMRAMDYLQTDTDIDPKKVAVIGHSRSGKASLWAGAQDTRFAAVISNDSGSTGAKLARRGDGGVGGETVQRINDSFPHWFPQTYKAYNNKVDSLPVDQHELIALVAPRRAIVASATDDGNADPQGEFLSYVNATPVYSLYGYGNNGLGGKGWRPDTGKNYRGDAMSYFLRAGGHGLTGQEWNAYMTGDIFSPGPP